MKQALQNGMKHISVNVCNNKNVGIKINADMNAKN